MVFLNLLFFSQGLWASKSLEADLIQLRSEIQSEADSLEALKKSINASVQSLTIEKGELKSRKKILSAQNQEMQKSLLKKKSLFKSADKTKVDGLALESIKGIKQIKRYIKDSVPFKKDQRLNKISNLIDQYNDQKITSIQLLEKYWSFLQDEDRLSRSVEIHSGDVVLNGKTYKTQQLKLGLISLYFKLTDGRLGHYVKSGDQTWKAEILEDSKSVKEVERLFSAVQKQIKSGEYELPLYIQNYEVKDV